MRLIGIGRSWEGRCQGIIPNPRRRRCFAHRIIRTMSSVTEIEAAIQKLPPEQFAQLRDWVAALDAKRWDAQIEADAVAGKLDSFAAQAIKDFKEGRCTGL